MRPVLKSHVSQPPIHPVTSADGNAQIHPTCPKVAVSRSPISRRHVMSRHVGFRRAKICQSPDGNAQFHPTGPKVASSRLPISSHVTSDSDRPKFVGSPDGNAQFHPMCPKVASPDGNAQFHPTGPKVASSRLLLRWTDVRQACGSCLRWIRCPAALLHST